MIEGNAYTFIFVTLLIIIMIFTVTMTKKYINANNTNIKYIKIVEDTIGTLSYKCNKNSTEKVPVYNTTSDEVDWYCPIDQ